MSIDIRDVCIDRVDAPGEEVWNLWDQLGSMRAVCVHYNKIALEQGKSSYCDASLHNRAKRYIVDLAVENREHAKSVVEKAVKHGLTEDQFNRLIVKYAIHVHNTSIKSFFRVINTLGLQEYSKLWTRPDGSCRVHPQVSIKNETYKDFQRQLRDVG